MQNLVIVPNERPTSPCLALATLDSTEKHSPHAPQPKIWQANDQTLLSLSSNLSFTIFMETNQRLLSIKTGHSEICCSIRNLACTSFITWCLAGPFYKRPRISITENISQWACTRHIFEKMSRHIWWTTGRNILQMNANITTHQARICMQNHASNHHAREIYDSMITMAYIRNSTKLRLKTTHSPK